MMSCGVSQSMEMYSPGEHSEMVLKNSDFDHLLKCSNLSRESYVPGEHHRWYGRRPRAPTNYIEVLRGTHYYVLVNFSSLRKNKKCLKSSEMPRNVVFDHF